LRAGRRPAGLALLGWLDDRRAPRICRITGSEGSGRTHLLDWLASAYPADAERRERRVHALVDASDADARGLCWLISVALGSAARTVDRLVAELSAWQGPLTIGLCGLDDAAGPVDEITAGLLRPLLSGLPQLRLLLDGAADLPPMPEVPDPAVLDLDDPQWTDAGKFADWCERLEGPGTRTASAAYPNPARALLIARSSAPTAEDWWAALPEELRPVVAALTVAARPLTVEQWSALPGARDPDAVRRAAALLPSAPGRAAWRLPRSLAALAAEQAPRPAAVLRYVEAAPVDDPELLAELRALRLRTAVIHSRAERLISSYGTDAAESMLTDPVFLVRTEPVSVTTALRARTDHLANAWRMAGPAMLALRSPMDRAAALAPYLTEHERKTLWLVGPPRWQVCWARPQPARTVRLGDIPGLLLVEDADGAVRSVEAATGSDSEVWAVPLPRPSADGRGDVTFEHWSRRLHDGPATDADATLVGGRVMVISGGRDGRVHLWKPEDGADTPTMLVEARSAPVSAVAVSNTGYGLLLVAAWVDGTLRVRRLNPGNTNLGLRLGAPVRSAVIDESGRIHLATADGLFAVELPTPTASAAVTPEPQAPSTRRDSEANAATPAPPARNDPPPRPRS
jgi:hypothetical protein